MELDFYTKVLCQLSRQLAMRRFLSQVPILWRFDKVLQDALTRARACTLSQLPRGAICAELGSWRGDFAAQILRETTPQRLHVVDPWVYDESPLVGDRLYESVVARFRESAAVRVHRTTSAEFLTGIEPGSLDWVYIDGDHSERAVAEDLRLAWKAVKPRGYLVGDDYDWRDFAGELTVKAAVDTFCRQMGVTAKMIESQFIIKKPN